MSDGDAFAAYRFADGTLDVDAMELGVPTAELPPRDHEEPVRLVHRRPDLDELAEVWAAAHVADVRSAAEVHARRQAAREREGRRRIRALIPLGLGVLIAAATVLLTGAWPPS